MKNDFLILIQKIGEVQRSLLWEKTKELGLSPMQIQMLLYIKSCEKNKSNVSHLSTYFNLKPPTVSESIKTLRTKGFLEQVKCLTDKRVHCYQLTEKAYTIIDKIDSWSEPLEKVFNQMTENDKICIVKNLYKVVYFLSQASLCCGLDFCLTCKFFRDSDLPSCKLLGNKFEDNIYVLNCPHYENIEERKPN